VTPWLALVLAGGFILVPGLSIALWRDIRRTDRLSARLRMVRQGAGSIELESEDTMPLVIRVITTIGETIAFIRTFDSPALVYEADLHHQLFEERSVIASLVTCPRSGLMTYVQLSDSNRWAPVSGNFNWVDILETLRPTGYDGWLALECRLRGDPQTALPLATRYLARFL